MNTNETDNFIYGGYVRKSSESEDRQVQSIERQKDDLLLLIEKEKLILNGDIIEETKSAFSIGRVGFNEMVKQTEKGKINAWLCWHPNRLSRNPMDAGIIVYLLDTGKLHHIKTPSRVFYNTPTDKMMLQFEFMMSKKDSDDKSSFVKSGLKKRYEKGFPCGKAPIGFLNNKLEEKGNRDWLVDQERFEKLQLLFNRFLKGNDSLNTITEYAQQTLQLTTPQTKRQGGKLVGRSLVQHILKNPVYAGFFYSKDAESDTKTLRKLNERVPTIISEDEHIKVLNIFGERHHPNHQKHKTPYTGHIIGSDGNTIGADVKFQVICDCNKKFAYRSKDVCPECGVKIIDMKSPKYLSYTYYFNINRRKTKGYFARGIEEKKIDQFLIDFYQEELQISDQEYQWAKKHLEELRDKELEADKKRMQIQQKNLTTLKAKKEKLRSLFMEELISHEEFKEDVTKLDKQLLLSQTTFENTENWYEQIEELLNNLVRFEDIIKEGDYCDKKQLLEQLRSNLIWDEQKLLVNKADWLIEYIKGRKILKQEFKAFEPKKDLINKGLNSVLDIRCPTLLRQLVKIRKMYCK